MNEKSIPPDQIKAITSKAAEQLFRRDYVGARKLYETLLRDNQTGCSSHDRSGKGFGGNGQPFPMRLKPLEAPLQFLPTRLTPYITLVVCC